MKEFLKKLITGDFINELFNFNSSSNNSMGDLDRSSIKSTRRAQVGALGPESKSKTKKIRRPFEGDCV